jgi:hypothetical protein
MPTSRSPFDRPRWNEADARAVIAALERSGQPVAVFAASHGLDPQRVYLWRRRLAGGEHTTFREVVVRPSMSAEATPPPFEVVLPSGPILRVPPCFDPDALLRLLHVLAQVSAC